MGVVGGGGSIDRNKRTCHPGRAWGNSPMRRTILITGSAKRLGAALAKGLAKDGHRIAIHFRTSLRDAQETGQAIRNAGGDAALFQNPLASLADGESLAKDIVAHFGSLD